MQINFQRLKKKSLRRFISNIPQLVVGYLRWGLGRIHPFFLRFVCNNSHLLRRYRKAVPEREGYKRVLHITCSFDTGGTQRQIKNICETSSTRGLMHEGTEIFCEYNFLFRQNEQIHPERYIRGGQFQRILGRLVVNPSTRSLQLVQIYKLWMDMKEASPDIVVGWGHEMAMLTFVAATLARVPRIVFCIRTFNPAYGWTAIGSLLKESHVSMVPAVDGIIVNSTALKKDYANWLNIPEDWITVCPNGICIREIPSGDVAHLRSMVRLRYHIPEEALAIVNVGRFSKEKGQLLLAKAFAEVVRRRPMKDLRLMLCGDGHTMDAVKEFLASQGLDEKVTFAGRVTDVDSYLCASDIFVMPSEFEGMPNAMMEAMALGLACISSNVTGALDVARNGMEALYYETGSLQQLIDHLLYLIDNPEMRYKLGNNAKCRLKNFSVNKMSEQFNLSLQSFAG